MQQKQNQQGGFGQCDQTAVCAGYVSDWRGHFHTLLFSSELLRHAGLQISQLDDGWFHCQLGPRLSCRSQGPIWSRNPASKSFLQVGSQSDVCCQNLFSLSPVQCTCTLAAWSWMISSGQALSFFKIKMTTSTSLAKMPPSQTRISASRWCPPQEVWLSCQKGWPLCSCFEKGHTQMPWMSCCCLGS